MPAAGAAVRSGSGRARGHGRGAELTEASPGSEPEALRRPAGAGETTRANRRWWDAAAADYQAEHGVFLRDDGFVWGPEGLDEAQVHLLGHVAGRRVLEVGCGAAQCSRWLAGQGAQPVGIDLSLAQLRHSRRIDARRGSGRTSRSAIPAIPAIPVIPVVLADAQRLPFADGSFDLACSAYGALPFVADAAAVLREVTRVLRPGGRWVFSLTHPLRWAFPDDPGAEGLVARMSYFDRTPYVEQDPDGTTVYVEHHRTLGDWVREVAAAGLRLVDLVEPEWPPDHTRVWGQWSPLRGRLLPGTAVFVCDKPTASADRER